MANINIYGTLHNVTEETIVQASQILYDSNTTLKDMLDNLYVKSYDFSINKTYPEVQVSSENYDVSTSTTIMNGTVNVNVPVRQTYNVEIQSYLPNVIISINGKYTSLKQVSTFSFEDADDISFQFLGDAYIKKITVRSGNKIPTNLSDLYNDVSAKTITADPDNETLNINNI